MPQNFFQGMGGGLPLGAQIGAQGYEQEQKNALVRAGQEQQAMQFVQELRAKQEQFMKLQEIAERTAEFERERTKAVIDQQTWERRANPDVMAEEAAKAYPHIAARIRATAKLHKSDYLPHSVIMDIDKTWSYEQQMAKANAAMKEIELAQQRALYDARIQNEYALVQNALSRLKPGITKEEVSKEGVGGAADFMENLSRTHLPGSPYSAILKGISRVLGGRGETYGDRLAEASGRNAVIARENQQTLTDLAAPTVLNTVTGRVERIPGPIDRINRLIQEQAIVTGQNSPMANYTSREIAETISPRLQAYNIATAQPGPGNVNQARYGGFTLAEQIAALRESMAAKRRMNQAMSTSAWSVLKSPNASEEDRARATETIDAGLEFFKLGE